MTKAFRHTYDNQHFFYYHQDCTEKNPPDSSVTFEEIELDSVPQGVQCDFCYEPMHGKSGYELREAKPVTKLLVTPPESLDLEKLRVDIETAMVVHWLSTQERYADVTRYLNDPDENLRIEAVNAGMAIQIVNPLDEVHIDFVYPQGLQEDTETRAIKALVEDVFSCNQNDQADKIEAMLRKIYDVSMEEDVEDGEIWHIFKDLKHWKDFYLADWEWHEVETKPAIKTDIDRLDEEDAEIEQGPIVWESQLLQDQQEP